MFVTKASTCAAVAAALCFAAPAQAAKGDTHAQANFSSCAKPHYPAASLAAMNEGTVHLSFLVEASGDVLEAKVKQSSGFDPLDAAARDAIKLCKFKPAKKNGQPVKDWVDVQYVWTLK
jgi:bla regulator protein BlaR1